MGNLLSCQMLSYHRPIQYDIAYSTAGTKLHCLNSQETSKSCVSTWGCLVFFWFFFRNMTVAKPDWSENVINYFNQVIWNQIHITEFVSSCFSFTYYHILRFYPLLSTHSHGAIASYQYMSLHSGCQAWCHYEELYTVPLEGMFFFWELYFVDSVTLQW